MPEVYPYNFHLLIYGDFGSGTGWYAPRDLDDSQYGHPSSLVIPVRETGEPFGGYWTWIVTLDEGQPKLVDQQFEATLIDDGITLNLPPADIPFLLGDKVACYRGSLSHPDLEFSLREIIPVKDDVYDLFFSEDKSVIIGTPFEHYEER